VAGFLVLSLAAGVVEPLEAVVVLEEVDPFEGFVLLVAGLVLVVLERESVR
jgi:hypothetical protein